MAEFHRKLPQPENSVIGQYTSTVQDIYKPYLIPQNYGLHTDIRHLPLTDSKGTGL